MSNHVLITGGAGFIGSHLADALLARGHKVRTLDNLSPQVHGENSGRPTYLHEDIELMRGDVRDPDAVQRALKGIDVVYHLAAAVGVKLIVEAPVHTIETNVHGTEVVLKHANKKKKLVVIASTSEVYVKSLNVPFSEDADLGLGPTQKHRWAYACSKLIDEFLALAYW
ncbi:MAG: GDP-mannose 4,6-dehydratase, partial [Gemmatimonadales bacterium]